MKKSILIFLGIFVCLLSSPLGAQVESSSEDPGMDSAQVESGENSLPEDLATVDALLEKGQTADADRVLKSIESQETSLETDRRRFRLAMATKKLVQAQLISRKYPKDLEMRVGHGRALMARGHRFEAKKTFQAVLKEVPGHPDASAGLQEIDSTYRWSSFLASIQTENHGFQDDRQIWTEGIVYAEKKAVSVLAHSRVDVISLTPGRPDYNEDILGAKVYYQLQSRLGAQIHLIHYENDDVDSDGSTVGGLALSFYPKKSRWNLGMEVDSSSYPVAKAMQYCLRAGYRFDRWWQAEVFGMLINLDGRGSRPEFRRNDGSVRVSVNHTPAPRWNLNLSGWFGERTAFVDSEALYAYNALDIYKTGWSLALKYRMNAQWTIFASLLQTDTRADWQYNLNNKFNFRFYPHHDVNFITWGVQHNF